MLSRKKIFVCEWYSSFELLAIALRKFLFLMIHLSPSLPTHRAGYLFYGSHFEF